MPEVFSSAETSLELVDPITDAVIMAIPFLRDDSFSESPNYGPRGYHRSAAVSAARLRSKGTITIRKDAEGMAFAREVERWQKGVIWYPMGSDLKGKRFRHPHIRKVMTRPDGTKEYRTAYDVRLSDRTLSRPDAGLVSESFTFEVQGGFDTPGSDRGEPVRALDFHRTGIATYFDTTGAFRIAQDGEPRFGFAVLPTRRNLWPRSEDFSDWTTANATKALNQGIDTFGRLTLAKIAANPGAASAYSIRQLPKTIAGQTLKVSFDAYGETSGQQWLVTVSNNVDQQIQVAVNLNTTVTRHTITLGPFNGTAASNIILQLFNQGAAFAWAAYFGNVQIEFGAETPYQPTNAWGVDYAHPLNGAGFVIEGYGYNYLMNSGLLDPNGDGTADNWDPGVTTARSNSNGVQTFTAMTQWGGFSRGVTFGADQTGIKVSVEVLGAGATCDSYFYDASANFLGGGTSTSVQDLDGGWQRIEVHANYPNVRTVVFRISDNRASGFTPIKFRRPSVEIGAPLRTSFIITPINSGASRFPDVVGLLHPHNLLTYSEFQNGFASPWTYANFYNDLPAAWSHIPGGGPGGKHAAQVVIPGGGNNAATTAIRPIKLEAGEVYTISAKVCYSSAGTLLLGFDSTNDGGVYAYEGDVAIPANSWVRVKSTLTASAAQQFIKIRPWVLGGGTATVTELQIVKGHHPGLYVTTSDTPIQAPISPVFGPEWQQNGEIELEVVTPNITENLNYGIFGCREGAWYDHAPMTIWRYAGFGVDNEFLYVERTTKAGRRSPGAVNGVFRNKNRIKTAWRNYFINGRQEMWHYVHLGDVLAYALELAREGEVEWASIDLSRIVSGGENNSTIRNLRFEQPALPPGANTHTA